ncbi:aldo/keto reductase, partial [Erwinia amylovora]|uniref:aldo/keto reductase n=1 Tax=Erwinia amylovora TaxID=552 RepID=UPI0020BF926D
HHPKNTIFARAPEEGLMDMLSQSGVGSIDFYTLAGGILTDRYLNGIPQDSRAASGCRFLNSEQLTPENMDKVARLNALAVRRGQKLSQLALAWVLRDNRVTSVLIGASKT